MKALLAVRGLRVSLPTATGLVTVVDGIDYDASYRFAMDDAIPWGLGGDMTITMHATNVMKNQTNPGFGFKGDPLRPNSYGQYFGYLLRAGLY